MLMSRRAHLSCDGKIKGACVEHSVSHTSNHTSLPGKSSAFPSHCLSLEHIHSALFCAPESPVSSIKGLFVFGYLFMDLFTSSLKMMSDTSTSRSVLCIMNEWSRVQYKQQPWWVSSEISNHAFPHPLKLPSPHMLSFLLASNPCLKICFCVTVNSFVSPPFRLWSKH